ncbi:uncharacterized protein LOC131301403 [Rhododendron vialii]|uniref:uncharacterized protein LOC131301403 n=1 Tax=Rhododendron vialii TaxID=182163 RepID=UPI00265EFE28|nr:uncharacterized protein LOC131301403 [Rhododendron vialii]
MGYPLEDTKPRNTPSHFAQKIVADCLVPKLGLDSKSPSHKTPLSAHLAQPQFAPTLQHQFNSNIHTKPSPAHQPNPKPITGQSKPKPKNWASLLQSQSPSLDMKLEHFLDLQKGKEALVEIDVELTKVGKWNCYLLGHLLDGKMAYPLLVSTARNQLKDLFVAVKPDVSGFYLFEFKDEQAKQ